MSSSSMSDSTVAESAESASVVPETYTLSWTREDIEQRIGFRGGRFTRVNNLLTLIMAIVLTVAFYAAIIPAEGTFFASMFTERGVTPYFIVLFSCWSLSILFIKWRKLALQEKALGLDILPQEHDFVLSAATVDQIFERMIEAVNAPKDFVVFNRISIALSNLRNLGRVTDVDEILRSQAEHDESAMETSYSLLRGFIWAIPVLGFIGTVLGLSQAIGGFGKVLGSSSDMSQIAVSLKVVTAGLATAFETTLVALVAALVIQMLYTFLKKNEEEFLDRCAEYCHRNIVNRLRIMPFQQEPD